MTWWRAFKDDFKWGVGILLFAVLAISGVAFTDWRCPVGEAEASGALECRAYAAPGTEGLAGLTDTLLAPTGLVVVMELLGVVLVAALIGALVMAIREKEVA